LFAYNCIAYNCDQGYQELTATNCISTASTDGFASCTGANNCSDIDSDAPAAGRITGTPAYTDAASGDFHLTSAATNTTLLIGGAIVLSGQFTTDIDGNARGDEWDVGPDEYSAGGGGGSGLFKIGAIRAKNFTVTQ
jgi:hypothetical protein